MDNDTTRDDDLRQELEGLDPELLADHQFLDVLLERIYRGDSLAERQGLENRLARVLATMGPRSPRRRLLPLLIPVAAAAIIAVVMLGFLRDPVTVQTVLEKALASASDDLDREYRLVTEVRRTPMSDPMSLEASLYLQGDSRFAYEFEMPRVGPFARPDRKSLHGWGGCDGEQFWLIPAFPQMPVYYSTDAEYFKTTLERMNLVAMPWLTVSSVLTNMGEHYDMELVPAAPADPGIRMRGVRRTGEEIRFPEVIYFTARRDTGAVQQLVLEWSPEQPLPVSRVTFDLVREATLPEGFYGHAAHHDADREVREWTPPGRR